MWLHLKYSVAICNISIIITQYRMMEKNGKAQFPRRYESFFFFVSFQISINLKIDYPIYLLDFFSLSLPNYELWFIQCRLNSIFNMKTLKKRIFSFGKNAKYREKKKTENLLWKEEKPKEKILVNNQVITKSILTFFAWTIFFSFHFSAFCTNIQHTLVKRSDV